MVGAAKNTGRGTSLAAHPAQLCWTARRHRMRPLLERMEGAFRPGRWSSRQTPEGARDWAPEERLAKQKKKSTKELCFEKVNEIDRLLAKLTENKREDSLS